MSNLRQPTLRVPLLYTQLLHTPTLDLVGLRCRLSLHLASTRSEPVAYPLLVDSGASYSIFSFEASQRDHIIHALADEELTLPTNTAQGRTSIRVRPGQIRAWWNAGLQGYPFTWSVLFRVQAPLGVPPVLGLGGIVKTCSWLFDGRYSEDAPYGQLTLEDTR